MEPFCFHDHVVVSGGGLREHVVLTSAKKMGDAKFVGLKSTDPAVYRMLAGTSWAKTRLLVAPVIAMMSSLRQEAIDRIISPPVVSDLGIDANDERPKKRSKFDISQVPEIITIQLPPLDGCDVGVAAKVLKGVGRDVVWVELTAEVIGHIAEMVRTTKKTEGEGDQVADGDCQQTNVQHISHCIQRRAYRVRYKGQSRWFPIDSFDDALHEAQCFLKQLQSCSQQQCTDAQHEGGTV